MGAGGQLDEVSKNLQNQIENLQKQMQELSSNQEMPMETKMKKRQELQKQISELEMQMRQHQMEVKREERQEKQKQGPSMDGMLGARKQEGSQGAGNGMSAGKEAELAKVNEAAQKMTASQMDLLSQATQTLEDKSKEGQNSTGKSC